MMTHHRRILGLVDRRFIQAAARPRGRRGGGLGFGRGRRRERQQVTYWGGIGMTGGIGILREVMVGVLGSRRRPGQVGVVGAIVWEVARRDLRQVLARQRGGKRQFRDYIIIVIPLIEACAT
ncbi:hypothetical protein EV426DRAFT_714845, partial [Tirmania nivea]